MEKVSKYFLNGNCLYKVHFLGFIFSFKKKQKQKKKTGKRERELLSGALMLQVMNVEEDKKPVILHSGVYTL